MNIMVSRADDFGWERLKHQWLLHHFFDFFFDFVGEDVFADDGFVELDWHGKGFFC